MQHIANLPFFEIEFDKDGKLHTPQPLAEAIRFLKDNAVTDLLVFSHGWNNDIADARDLYKGFFTQAAGLIQGNKVSLGNRKFALLGLYWPSKKFTDQDLIPGGAAAFGGDESQGDLIELLEELKTEPVRLGEERPIAAADRARLDRAEELVPRLENDPAARREFVDLIRAILPQDEAHPDDGSDLFFSRDPDDLLQEAALPVPALAAPEPGLGGAAGGLGGGGFGGPDDLGGAAGLGDLFSGITAGARRLLNFTTYYRMKARAGTVGAQGLAPALAQIRRQAPQVKLHLIGHSFGGRVVTAAAHALPGSDKVDSLSLLQAAFSHNGFAQRFNGRDDGFFRSLVAGGRVAGPVLITHTRNDKAVGIAYPLASRIAGQNAAGLGDREDPYGGLGRNGAIFTPEASDGDLGDVGHRYGLAAGSLYNLHADRYISNHSDVTGPQVAYAVLSAVAAT
ncbi:MAG: alpha/beta fold hydrolase [Pseudomonadota bacterium]|nr:alpha/beta fold hydrolase [Pseudomonadota bacterium]